MNSLPQSIFEPRELAHLLAIHWRRWLFPAILVAVLAAVYAQYAPPVWRASQALMIRNEATAGDTAPGKFSRTEDMKTIQETILELAKSQSVLAASLKEVGPPANRSSKEAWPTDLDVDSLQQAAKISPPKGVEFGTAEIFYLEVRDNDRVRAVRLNQAICNQLLIRFQEIRDAKAQSLIGELAKTVQLAKADLQDATGRLTKLETSVGGDLAELRVLQDSSAGESVLRRSITEIESELRQTRVAETGARQLLGLLQAAKDDPGRLVAAPSRLLDSQPALKRLKEGLVDAQLRTARLQGRMSPLHPVVIAAKQGEEEIGRHLHSELAIAIRGLETELQLNTDRIAMLDKQLAQSTQRLGRLAEVRATYANMTGETTHRARLLERAEQNLADARASAAGAKTASLISCIDTPETGTRPVSPSRTVILLAGILGGLVTGLSTVLLTVPPRQSVEVPSVVSLWPSHEIAPQEHAEPTCPTTYPSTPCRVATATAHNGTLSLRQALKVLSDRPNLARSAQ